MIFPKAKRIAKELGWYKANDGVFGMYKGYFFNIGDGHWLSNPQYKYVIATTDTLTDDQQDAIRKELIANRKMLKFDMNEVGRRRIYIHFIENLSFTRRKTIYKLLDFLVDLLKQHSIPEQYKCHHCGEKEHLHFCTHTDRGMILCNTCFRKEESKFNEMEGERNEEDKNYLAGFFGSLVFSLPGIIVWVVIAVYGGVLAAAMAIAIAFLGQKGYAFFKGRLGSLTKYIIVFSNILCILFANWATIMAMLMREGLTLSESWHEFQLNELAKDLLVKNTLISFVLAFFIWLWLLVELKEKGPTVHMAEKYEA